MDYEKAYKEALNRAKGAHNSAKSDKENGVTNKITEYTIQLTETIFPELKESEDERIRKDIVFYIAAHHKDDGEKARWLYWLEKQGQDGKVWFYRDDYVRDKKQAYQDGIDSVLNNPQKYGLEKQGEKHIDRELSNLLNRVICRFINDPNIPYSERDEVSKKIIPYVERLEKQGWQKPAWSEEDKSIVLGIEQLCNCASLLNIAPDKIDKIRTWLKSLKDRVQLQPKWSEKDENMLNSIIDEVMPVGECPDYPNEEERKYYYDGQEKVDWLKSLRPQNRWKPSEEQIKALVYVFNHYIPNATDKIAWNALQTIELMLGQLLKEK